MASQPLALLAPLLLATVALGQRLTITPFNGSLPSNQSANIELLVSDAQRHMLPFAPVAPLSQRAQDLPPTGLSGQIFSANADNQLNITNNDIVLMSCDAEAYSGNIKASDVYGQAESKSVRAVLLYSAYSDYCEVQGAGSVYNFTYTMKRPNDTAALLSNVRAANSQTLWAQVVLSSTVSTTSTSDPSSTSSASPVPTPDPGGPAPSTAVAMIILYSITGLITALFLGIIITGAVRAHRHPERYGPRAAVGRIRQSRARGLAKAMLDSLPIVKFGDRQEPGKPSEIELENGEPRESSPADVAEGDRDVARASETAERDDTGTGMTNESGIAPAAGGSRTDSIQPSPEENQGCSICTEDFEVGQDQRVLPCDHRFHPACVDPWLLNVSGTCPLCRIDLRGESADAEEVDADANPAPMAPPLNDTTPAVPGDRSSRRRTMMLAIVGQFRADHMTREERISALRRFREQNHAQSAENASSSPTTAEATEEEESSMRRRFRRVLRITTRRSPPTASQAPALAQESSDQQTSTT